MGPENTVNGSGLDADLLDGQHGAYYLDWDNLTDLFSSAGNLVCTCAPVSALSRSFLTVNQTLVQAVISPR